MNREFLDLYNRELDLLYEHAAEFAADYPQIAGRLGGLLREHTDPMVAGLLEGTAFLAARVQLKLKHEFPEFTSNLLDLLVPNVMAPTPSAMMVRVEPPFGDPGLSDGRTLPAGAALDAAWLARDRQVACRYRLASPVTLFPLAIVGAEYYATPGPLQAQGVPVRPGQPGGMKLSLVVRSAAHPENEPSEAASRKLPQSWFAQCRIDTLPIHLIGPEADADAIYEQLVAHCRAVWFRYADEFGNPVVVEVPRSIIEQVGFDEEEALFPADNRVFRGFELLREHHAFPRKFLGVRLVELRRLAARIPARSFDVFFAFDEVNARLSAAVQAGMFALHCAPAVNLFEMSMDRIRVNPNQHEYHVVPDRSRPLDFEPHRVLEVHAHVPGGGAKVPVPPLYEKTTGAGGGEKLYYTVARRSRRRTSLERKYGSQSTYVGTDMFLSLGEPSQLGEAGAVAELSVRALCSNRHLTEHVPVGAGGSDFYFVSDTSLGVTCVAGPTRPREPVASPIRSRTETASTGEVLWRLVNMLSLNHLGLVNEGAGGKAEALREMLTLFADTSDSATERRIAGVRSVESRPVVRRIRQRGGVGPARGTEVTVTLDDKAYEGTGVFLLGAVLDRFMVEYAAFNHFTQLVLRTQERGEIVRWPARVGARRAL